MRTLLFSSALMLLAVTPGFAQTYLPAQPYRIAPAVQLNLNVIQQTSQQMQRPMQMHSTLMRPTAPQAMPLQQLSGVVQPQLMRPAPQQIIAKPIPSTRTAPQQIKTANRLPVPIPQKQPTQAIAKTPALNETVKSTSLPQPEPWPVAKTPTEKKLALPLTQGEPAPLPKPIVQSPSTNIARPQSAPVVAAVVPAPKVPAVVPVEKMQPIVTQAPTASLPPISEIVEETPPPPAPQQLAALPAEAIPKATTEQQTPNFISFQNGSTELTDADKIALDAVVKQMGTIDGARLQLRAYASGTPQTTSQARRLSLARALAVRSYLLDQGIKAPLMDIRALGNGSAMGESATATGKPADRVDIMLQGRG